MKAKDNASNSKQSEFRPSTFEEKWQKKWENDKIFAPQFKLDKKPFYNLMMFPYPSAEGLHVGNMYAQTGADVYGRFKRMEGYNVFEPMGLDGFGIHSENYALKIGKNPMDQAKVSEDRFYKQMKAIGTSIDWSRTLETYDPAYYKWTQWLFIELFKAGLAYRKKAEVNWCPSCKTVLSDEQVIDGKCERCSTVVVKKDLEQWFFKITEYAERLLNNIESLDWTEKVKIAQRNWIGKSEGAVIDFQVDNLDYKIKVFTTRADTLYGATFLVIAPEHHLLKQAQPKKSKEVSKYIEISKNKSNQERTAEDKEKTGVFSGLYAINPINNKKIPIWIADYVLIDYGTGAIMAVPAHDTRDFAFAKTYNLPIEQVIQGKDSEAEEAYVGSGKLINSEEWNGLEVPRDIPKVIESLTKRGLGSKEVNYHLRDWLISRQRYWGPPIPMIFCENCFHEKKGEKNDMPGWYSAPENELPILLPNVEDWKPLGTGKSPLANHPEFYQTKCPNCAKDAVRETDVSDTFLDSSWYFLGYICSQITENSESSETIYKDIKKHQIDKKTKSVTSYRNLPWESEIEHKWLPVTKYIGGAEHSVLHLLYSRFISMVLYDLKFTHFEEPFSSFFAHGLIIKDGAKMSKSKGNVVVPDLYIEKYGADTLRTYLMFLGPFSDGGDFRDSGIEGMNKFLKRVWTLLSTRVGEVEMSAEGKTFMHKTVKRVGEDIESFKYNTAIAGVMEWYNFLSNHKTIHKEEAETFLKLLAPFAPFMTEELWSKFGHQTSLHLELWPKFDDTYLVSDEVIIVVQVNGKRRGEFTVQKQDLNNPEKIKEIAKETASAYTKAGEIKNTIYVPGKIVNFVM